MTQLPLRRVPVDETLAAPPASPETSSVEHDSAGRQAALTAAYGAIFEGEQVDGVYRGAGQGFEVVVVTNRRLLIIDDAGEERTSLTSVPFGRVTSVGLLSPPGEPVAAATTVQLRVLSVAYELDCRSEDEACEMHDLITWHLIGG
jgi:hypothetical protein